MKHNILFLLFLILISCNKIELYSDLSNENEIILLACLEKWESHEGVDFVLDDREIFSDLRIYERESLENNYHGLTSYNPFYSDIYINVNAVTDINIILLHEIGHHLGYGHSKNENSIMYRRATNNLFIDLQRK